MAFSCIFASQPEQFDQSLFTAVVASGGNTTVQITRYYWVQGLSRGGLNLQTSLGQRTVGVGEKLTVSMTSIPNGSETFAFVLSASTTNDASLSRVLAIAWIKDADQQTTRTFPIEIELTENDHFTIGGSVASIASLNSVAKITGTIRSVIGESRFYLYDSEGWLPESQSIAGWIQCNGDRSHLTSTRTPRLSDYLYGGADCPIVSLAENSSIDAPSGWNSGSESIPIKLWMLNKDQPVTGGQFSFTPSVDSSPILGQYLLDQAVSITPTNLINKTDGSIDSPLTNVPIIYTRNTPFYTLETAIQPDIAIEFEVVTYATIGNGQTIDFVITYLGDVGTIGDFAFLGDAVIAENSSVPVNSKFLRCLPSLIEVGAGIISIPNSIKGYSFNRIATQSYIDLLLDTPDQIVAVNGQQNGRCRVIQSQLSLLDTESIRAFISTESGVQTASDWSAEIPVSANGQIELTLSFPTAIRSDYPDNIAGMDAPFTIDEIIVELRYNDITSYIFSAQLPTTTIVITSTSGTSGTLPTVNSDADFGCFDYDAIAISENASQGILPAGNYKARIYYQYSGTSISKISHDTGLGCIPELAESLSQIVAKGGKVQVTANDTTANYLNNKITDSPEIITTVNNNGANESLSLTPVYWRSPISTKATLKSLAIASLTEGEGRIILENNAPYIYRLTLPSADDGDNYLKSNDGTTQGWIKSGGQSSGGGGLTQTASLTTLRAITNGVTTNFQLFQVTGTNGIYQRINGRTDAENSPFIIRPNDYASVNAIYVLKNAFDQNGALVFNSDKLTQGTTNLFLTPSERVKITNLASNANSTYAAQGTTITGNEGISGGGDLSSNKTLSLAINNLTEETAIASDDYLAVFDTSTGGHRKITPVNLGLQGWDAWAQTSTTIDWSSTIFPVQLTLTNGENTGFVIGQYLYLSNVTGTSTATLKVTAKSGTNLITLDKDDTEYTYPSSGTLSNGILTPTGVKGDTGSTGTLSVFSESSAPTTGAGEHGIFADLDGFLKHENPNNSRTDLILTDASIELIRFLL